MKDKLKSVEEFHEQFKLLSETEKNNFSRLVNILQNQTFIIHDKESDRADYLFLFRHRDLFSPFFEIIDYEFVYDAPNQLFYVKTLQNRNRFAFHKFETALLLILRELYYVKKKEVTSEVKVIVSLEDIMGKLRTTQIFKEEKKLTNYEDAMRLFRRYKLIDFVAKKVDETTNFEILPSIQILIPQDKLEDILSRLMALKVDSSEGGDENENPDED